MEKNSGGLSENIGTNEISGMRSSEDEKMIYKNLILNGRKTDITTENGLIASIEKNNQPGLDLGGNEVYPGLIDIHIHGGLGRDVTYDGDAIEKLSKYLGENGITAWYPTTVTEAMEKIQNATEQKTDFPGAQVLGFHTEGPYIARTGAMKSEYAKNPDLEEFKKLKNVKLLTVAPELPGVNEFIKNCEATVCLGHTACDYETAVKAIRSGAKCLTHTFNVMPPFLHREPSLIGAAITEDCYVQVISDGVHLHKAAVIALYRIFGPERMILISDAMAPMGTKEDTVYEMNGKKMYVKNGVAYTDDGRLYGSASNLFSCVKTAISFGIPKEDAFKMASYTPAKLMGLSMGEIKPGNAADFIVINEKTELLHTVIRGEMVK